jgi:hypothetical protein
VIVDVRLRRFFGVLDGVKMVTVRDVRVVRRFFVIARFMVFGGFAMMTPGFLVMLRRSLMMFCSLFGHGLPPGLTMTVSCENQQTARSRPRKLCGWDCYDGSSARSLTPASSGRHVAGLSSGSVLATTALQALLEQGPKQLAELEDALGFHDPTLLRLLSQLGAGGCETCGRLFLPGRPNTTRYCSRACSPRGSIPSAVASREAPVSPRLPTDQRTTAAPADQPAAPDRSTSPARGRNESRYDVVWNGVGPLPGAGEAAGLGSSLSGIRFSVGKRV